MFWRDSAAMGEAIYTAPSFARESVIAMAVRAVDTCNSCGTRLLTRGSVVFACPSCGGAPIGRCPQCRDQGVHYACGSCGYAGP